MRFNNLSRFLPVLLLLCSIASLSQPYTPDRIIPPSPTAASLGVYGNYSVGYYSGRPDISIPLYEVQTNSHSLPITLQYDASGVRASQQASWVGLNWSLSAGGVITRTVRGIDDFTYQGFYNAPALPTEITLATKPYYDQISAGTMDAEADVFSFNAGPHTGKFVMGKKAEGGQAFIDKASNIQIKYFEQDERWELTDTKGFKYYFATQEIVISDYYYSGGIELMDNAPLSQYTYSIQRPITTTWYLDSIVSPTAEAIKFVYQQGAQSLSQVQKTEKRTNLLSIIGYCPQTSPRFTEGIGNYSSSRQVIQDRHLQKIVFQNGSIQFMRADRNDIEYIGNEKPDRLLQIIVKDAQENFIRGFTFGHSYFLDGFKGRLKLDSITEYDGFGNKKPPHKFTYFSTNLPHPYSKALDHWGFYNEKTSNDVLLPEMIVDLSNSKLKVVSGGDRTSSESDDILKQGVLASIVYPTGGTTDFDYEIHKYTHLHESDAFKYADSSKSVYARPRNPYDPNLEWDYAVRPFTLTSPARVDLEFWYSQMDPNSGDPFASGFHFAEILGANNVAIHSYNKDDCRNEADPTCQGPRIKNWVILPEGSYKLKVWYMQGWETNMIAYWKNKVPVTQRNGGGLRIKSIINSESGKTAAVRKFLYTDNGEIDGAPSGKLISLPKYGYIFSFQDPPLDGDCSSYWADYLSRSSNSIFGASLTSSPAIIGYDIVTEVIGENGEGGKTMHFFHNEKDVVYGSFFPYLPPQSSPLNGKPVQSITLNAQGDPISKIEYFHTVRQSNSVWSIKLFKEVVEPFSNDYRILPFYDYTNWVVQTWEKKTDNIDTGPIVTQRFFNYDNPLHKELTSTSFLKSDGTNSITKYKYPGDYTTAGTASFVYQMKLKNITSPVIEEQTLVTRSGVTKLVGGTFTSYKLVNNAYYKPDILYKINATEPLTDTRESDILVSNQITLHPSYQQEVVFDSYTLNGNLESFHKPKGEYSSYIWGYQSSLPVAQVINASASKIAYTSFESDNTGGWNYGGIMASAPYPASATGKKFYNLTTNGLNKSGLTSGENYIVSYWSKNGAYSITGGSAEAAVKMGTSFHGWTYFEHLIKTSTTAVSINGTGAIDEVRLYPATAQITTYTHDLLTGMSSSTDNNGITTYYEYDGFQRLKAVKDQYGNIVRAFRYNYKN